MTHEEIMAIPIENVEESEWEDNGSIFIFFELNGISCYFEVFCSEDDVYSPSMISYGGKKFCRYCKQKETYCPKLEAHRETIFERVIQSKPIRLNWLYREYTFH